MDISRNNSRDDKRPEEIGISINSVPLQHLSKMAPVDIEFADLTYSVPTGRKGMFSFLIFIFMVVFISRWNM